jgi:hypothetical protein
VGGAAGLTIEEGDRSKLLCDAGMRIEPQVSLPMPTVAKLGTGAAAGPTWVPVQRIRVAGCADNH